MVGTKIVLSTKVW